MNINLQNKKAIVCGSTQGIGRASANAMAELGAEIILLARNEEELKKVQNELPRPNRQNHQYIVADFNNQEDLKEKVDNFTKSNDISILINNTGGPAAGELYKAGLDEFKNAFNLHIICNQILVQSVLDGMKKLNYGRIINIISTSVKVPIPGLGVSNTIRGAVANWAKTLSYEIGKYGITVNNILPGFTETERLNSIINTKSKNQNLSQEEVIQEMKESIPAKRFALASEIADAVAFLASPAASYINGVNLPVDGGRTPSL